MTYVDLSGLGGTTSLSFALAFNPTVLDSAIRKAPGVLFELEHSDPRSFMILMKKSAVAKAAYKKKIEDEERAAAERVASESVYYPKLDVPDLKITSAPKVPARTWNMPPDSSSEIGQALSLLNTQYNQSLNSSMQDALNSMGVSLQEAAMNASFVRLGLDLTMKALPIAAWVSESINAVLDSFGSKYQAEARDILENARKQALAKQAASKARVNQKFTQVIQREKPYAISLALNDLGLPIDRPPSELEGMFDDFLDKLKDFGRDFERTFIRPVAHAARSYIGGRIVKEKAREEANRILSIVDNKVAAHEANINKITDSIEFRLAVREELANIAEKSPEVKAIANKYHQAVMYVKTVVAAQIKEKQKQQESIQAKAQVKAQVKATAKKYVKPLVIGGAVIAAAALLMD